MKHTMKTTWDFEYGAHPRKESINLIRMTSLVDVSGFSACQPDCFPLPSATLPIKSSSKIGLTFSDQMMGNYSVNK